MSERVVDPSRFLKDFIAGTTRASLEQLNEAIHASLQIELEEVIAPAIRATSKHIDMTPEEFSRRIEREFVPNHGFSASATINSGRDRFRIELFLGLPLFYFVLGQLLGRGTGAMDAQDGSIIDHGDSESTAIQDIVDFLKGYSENGGLIRGYELAEGLSDRDKQLARYFKFWVMRFVIGHELGHVVTSVSPGVFPLAPFTELAGQLLSEERVPDEWDREEVILSWARELQADRVGLRVAQEQFDRPVRIRNCLGGAIVFFLGASLADSVLRGHANAGSTTHPPPLARLSALIAEFEPLPVQQRGFVLGLRAQLQDVLIEMGSSDVLPPLCDGTPPQRADFEELGRQR